MTTATTNPRLGLAPASPRSSRATLVVLGFLLLVTIAGLSWLGFGFYVLPLDERIDHPAYRLLRPSGLLGNGLGYAAALLVVANLSYLARRKQLIRFFTMRTWLDIHVFTGLLAYVLAVYHSAFQLRSSVARVTALSMGVVIVTGIIGRILHVLLARPVRDRTDEALAALEAVAPGAGKIARTMLAEHPVTVLPIHSGLATTFRTMGLWRSEAEARRVALQAALGTHAAVVAARRAEPALANEAVTAVLAAAAAEVGRARRAAFLRSWRSLHRFFALGMIALVLFHAGVAWHFGYRWIF